MTARGGPGRPAWWTVTAAAAGLAVVWWRWWPAAEAVGTSGPRYWAIRAGHSLAWTAVALLLAGRAAGATGGARRVTEAAGPVALACYVGFLAAAFLV